MGYLDKDKGEEPEFVFEFEFEFEFDPVSALASGIDSVEATTFAFFSRNSLPTSWLTSPESVTGFFLLC